MSERPRNVLVDLGELGSSLREIGCPQCELSYRSMKVGRDGTPVARFQGDGNIRAVEIEVDEGILRALDTHITYVANSVIRETQERIDVDFLGQGTHPGTGDGQ